MKLTHSHLRFWIEHQPQPSWASSIVRNQPPVTIHKLINVQAGVKIESEPHNTIQILKSVRSRGEPVWDAVKRMAILPNCANGAKRLAYCRRWWRRLRKEAGCYDDE